MNDDNDFHKTLITAIWSFAVAIVLTAGGCTMQQNYLLSQSTNPMALSCAMGDMNKPVCALAGKP